MKYLKLFNEGKQVGILYHYTNPESALNILKDNEMKTGQYGINAFTRNKNYHKKTSTVRDGAIKFTIDGDKLSNNNKIFPWSSWIANDKTRQKRKNYYNEYEERIKDDIKNINKYIIKIEIDYERSRSWFIVHNIEGEWSKESLEAALPIAEEKLTNFLKEIKELFPNTEIVQLYSDEEQYKHK